MKRVFKFPKPDFVPMAIRGTAKSIQPYRSLLKTQQLQLKKTDKNVFIRTDVLASDWKTKVQPGTLFQFIVHFNFHTKIAELGLGKGGDLGSNGGFN